MRLRFESCVMDLGSRQVFRDGRELRLSPKAFQLLELLAARRPNALSKEEILDRLWPGVAVSEGSLANVASELRDALDDDARHPRILRTVQRYGYAFQAEAQVETEGPSEAERPASSKTGCSLSWDGRDIALAEGENLMGRDPAAAVWIDKTSVSRYHARILIDGTSARIEDLGSKNGTFVRGQRVTAGVPLRDGDEIRLGSIAMLFHRSEAGHPTRTATV